MDHINRMREEIVARIARDMPARLYAESLGVLAQELLMQAAHRRGRAYARGWLEVIEAHLRNDIDAAAHAMMRLHGRWCTCRKAGDLAPVLSRYAMTRRRRTDFGRPAASIRLRTATPMAASVCCAAKPRARSRGPISAL